MLEIINAKVEHVPPIAKNMRAADAHEVWAASRFSPHDAVNFSFNVSEKPYTAIYKGEPIMMFGAARESLLSTKGVPWLLGTPDIIKAKLAILKRSRKYINEMLQDFELLENYVHNDNKISIAWLRWCGFTVEAEQPRGPDNELFRRFRKERVYV